MILARKHLDPNTCVLRVMTLILGELVRRRVAELDTLRQLVQRRSGDDALISFLPALEVLYLLGKIDFHPKTDTIELLV